ncbi:hypothetical protein MAIC_51420 [Mycolicibacterium aichiense]|uniref:Uncharacterized protein n=1 Tax=Mycolicibacterium aichiense TaxID=1799 RepID=A0AAD1MFM0_9MYCO|nr:hypothetical protein MAIC_51420 [Mycolicibacterium aichiense]
MSRGPDLVPGGWVTRVGKVPGNVGATRSDGGMVDWSLVVVGVVLLVVLSPGSPISVVESRTLGYDVLVDPAVVFAMCGASGMYVPGGGTVSVSVLLHSLDIVTTA